jgi:hypothetical protein
MLLQLKSLTLNPTVQEKQLFRNYLHSFKVSLIYTVHWAQNIAGSCDTEAISILFNVTATKVMARFFS